jgi:hypothetical protein
MASSAALRSAAPASEDLEDDACSVDILLDQLPLSKSTLIQ